MRIQRCDIMVQKENPVHSLLPWPFRHRQQTRHLHTPSRTQSAHQRLARVLRP
ncbi:hypothetical protein M3J09_010221 [Ascochyta lentis]